MHYKAPVPKNSALGLDTSYMDQSSVPSYPTSHQEVRLSRWLALLTGIKELLEGPSYLCISSDQPSP